MVIAITHLNVISRGRPVCMGDKIGKKEAPRPAATETESTNKK